MALINRKGSNAAFDGGRDQYYTPAGTAEWATEQALLAIGWAPPLIVEPSAGTGEFLPFAKMAGCPVKAFDVDPRHPDVSQANWLAVPPSEFKGGLVLGNPPYGHFGNEALRFINHAAKSADWIAFILPPIFGRTTMKRRISLNFGLILEVKVPNDGYYGPNGEQYKHPRILQVWQRLDEPRLLDPLPDGKPWVEHLSGPEGADAYVIRNGGRAGQVLVGGSHSIGFAWPMKMLRPDSLEVLRSLEPQMIAMGKTGTSVPNMPKIEINVALAGWRK